MAELKTAVMSTLAILFMATASVTIFSYALVNNAASGGTGTDVPFPLLNQTAVFTAQIETYSQQLSNSTSQAATTPSASLSTIGGGVGAITQAGTASISLAFSALNIMLGMIGSVGASLTPIGIPPIVTVFGIISVTIGIVFAILSAVFKWWL